MNKVCVRCCRWFSDPDRDVDRVRCEACELELAQERERVAAREAKAKSERFNPVWSGKEGRP